MHINQKVLKMELVSLKEEGNTVLVQYYSNSKKRVVKRKSVLPGECYYEENAYGFNEYLCKNN